MSQYYETPNQEVVSPKSSTGLLSFAKVFLYMFIGLAITAAVAFGVGAALAYTATDVESLTKTCIGLWIGSGIVLIILMIVINFVVMRGKHSVLIPAILYAVTMGVLMSAFTLFVDWRLLGMAFGITSGAFLIMTLIAVFTKGNLSPLLMVAMGLMLGGLILALVNWLVGSETIYWLVSFAIFAAIMFITIFDIWNIKKITERGAMNSNLELYCAFTLYVDFIYILIRIIYFLILIYGKSR